MSKMTVIIETDGTMDSVQVTINGVKYAPAELEYFNLEIAPSENEFSLFVRRKEDTK